jgi:alkanesulfonate monooxygenase SsuD/methylene tetrahydromethanopterin reductase-like flavin-dependent oxidoreductase (luciferase family)
MRFGVFDHNDASGRPAARQIAERLELVEAYQRLGFYAYHMAEHHNTPLSITASPHLMLAAASQRTSTLRLGTLISILPLYHPLRMIEEVCTLDQLTNGRLDLGVGRGISPIETSFHGVPGPETQDRFNEAFEILRTGLTSQTVSFQGRYYQIDNAPMVTRPVQRPHPPLWYGARTLDRALWCARLGMPMMALVPSEQVRPLTDAYRAEWASLGRPDSGLPPLGVTRSMVVAPTSEDAMKIANRAFGRFKESFELLWHRAGMQLPPVLPADTFEGIHNTGHYFAGDPAGARAWVERIRDVAGISYLAIELCFGDMTRAEALQSAELIATEVMPAVQLLFGKGATVRMAILEGLISVVLIYSGRSRHAAEPYRGRTTRRSG